MASKRTSGAKTAENTQKARDRRKDARLTPEMEQQKWRPGQSGNPGGRPKSVFRAAFLRVLERQIIDKNGKPTGDGKTYADVIAEQIVAAAAKGKIDALRELADRVDGKPMQEMRLGGEGGGPVQFENRSPDEIRIRLAELLAKVKDAKGNGKGRGARG